MSSVYLLYQAGCATSISRHQLWRGALGCVRKCCFAVRHRAQSRCPHAVMIGEEEASQKQGS